MSYGTPSTTNQIGGIFGGSVQRTTPDRIGTKARRSGPVNLAKCGGGAATFRSAIDIATQVIPSDQPSIILIRTAFQCDTLIGDNPLEKA